MFSRLKYCVFFTGLFILASCGAINKNYFGTYYHHVPNFVQSEITIKPDSTFEYQYSSGLEETQVMGTWYIDEKGYLNLNSDKKLETDSIKVEEIINEEQDSIIFFVSSFENEPLGGATITFNDVPNFGVNLNGAGKVKISKDLDFKGFNISYLGYSYSYDVINNKASSFKVKVYYPDPKDAYYQYFIDDKWKLKGNKLIDIKENVKYIK